MVTFQTYPQPPEQAQRVERQGSNVNLPRCLLFGSVFLCGAATRVLQHIYLDTPCKCISARDIRVWPGHPLNQVKTVCAVTTPSSAKCSSKLSQKTYPPVKEEQTLVQRSIEQMVANIRSYEVDAIDKYWLRSFSFDEKVYPEFAEMQKEFNKLHAQCDDASMSQVFKMHANPSLDFQKWVKDASNTLDALTQAIDAHAKFNFDQYSKTRWAVMAETEFKTFVDARKLEERRKYGTQLSQNTESRILKEGHEFLSKISKISSEHLDLAKRMWQQDRADLMVQRFKLQKKFNAELKNPPSKKYNDMKHEAFNELMKAYELNEKLETSKHTFTFLQRQAELLLEAGNMAPKSQRSQLLQRSAENFKKAADLLQKETDPKEQKHALEYYQKSIEVLRKVNPNAGEILTESQRKQYPNTGKTHVWVQKAQVAIKIATQQAALTNFMRDIQQKGAFPSSEMIDQAASDTVQRYIDAANIQGELTKIFLTPTNFWVKQAYYLSQAIAFSEDASLRSQLAKEALELAEKAWKKDPTECMSYPEFRGMNISREDFTEENSLLGQLRVMSPTDNTLTSIYRNVTARLIRRG